MIWAMRPPIDMMANSLYVFLPSTSASVIPAKIRAIESMPEDHWKTDRNRAVIMPEISTIELAS